MGLQSRGHLNLVGTLGSQSSEGVSKWPEIEADKDTKGTGVGVEGRDKAPGWREPP